MGRREEPLDPDGPLYEFAAALRALRAAAGSPTYRELARVAHVSQSALAAAASGRNLPSWGVTAAYVKACGGDLGEWRSRWEERRGFLNATNPGLLTDSAASGSPPPAPEGGDAPPGGPGPALPTSPAGRLRSGDPRKTGPLRILGRLGQGSMGMVYLGATPAGRPVAVKVIKPEYAGDPLFRRRFAQELAAVRRVAGGHTPAVVDADASAKQPWLAVEFVPGPSLEQVVMADGPLPELVVWGLAAGIAEALAAIHAAGIVHRDLKPSNILLDRDGPKVIDFGICRALDGTALTTAGMRVGTAGYTAPEQAERGESTPAGDVFALGAVLAYAATGVAPFGEGSGTEVLYRVVHEPPAPEALACEDNNLRALIESCLAKDPADRPEPARVVELASGAMGSSIVTLPSAIAARAAARDSEAAGLLTRARRLRLARIGMAPLIVILAIATISAISLRNGDGAVHLDTGPAPVVHLPRSPSATPSRTSPSPSVPPSSPSPSRSESPSDRAPLGVTPPTSIPATTSTAGPVVARELTPPDFNGYCQATGQGTAYLAADNAYGWRCSSPNSTGDDAQAVCEWTNGDATHITNRVADFTNPDSWQCWATNGEVGGIDWNTYCQDKGLGAVYDSGQNDAYTWYCTESSAGIDAQDACETLYGTDTSISRFQDFYDKNSWQCWD